jgi:3-deoxy-D-manno-octulosonate 8-phosphate phosphatase (KDO 8-P phosphatase)
VRRRGLELAIGDVFQGAGDKVRVFAELIEKYGLLPEEAGYVGDDLNDLAVMDKVGLACAVANAVPEVKARAHYIAARQGGAGAVREIIEFVLKAQDKWEAIVAAYSQPGDSGDKQ